MQMIYLATTIMTMAQYLSDGKIYVGFPNGVGWNELSSTSNLIAGNWGHIVTAHNGSQQRIYINGILDKSRDQSISLINSTINLIIGDYHNGGYSFNGTIDEVRIYNRALSPTEVLNNYNGYISRDGLVLEHIYSLGNANDLSGYGNNGTPVNGPVFIPNACMDTCTVAIGCIAPICNFVVT